MSAGGNDNTNDDSDNMVFDQKDAKIFASVVTLSVKIIQNYQNFSVKDSKNRFIGMNIRQKKEKNNK